MPREGSQLACLQQRGLYVPSPKIPKDLKSNPNLKKLERKTFEGTPFIGTDSEFLAYLESLPSPSQVAYKPTGLDVDL